MLSIKELFPSRRALTRILLVLTSLYGAQSSVNADVLINFNSLPSNASNTGIRDYMNGVFAAAGQPAIISSVAGAQPGNNYNGDGHVVGGIANNGNYVPSLTLGSIDGGNFLMTHNSNLITMVLTQPIFGITFDMEIFPEVSNTPDFTFKAYASGGTLLEEEKFLGVVPTAPNDKSPVNPGGGENYKQLLAFGLNYTFPGGATKLEFIDWPPTIGIDNLLFQLTPPPTTQVDPIPEPATMLLFIGGLAGVGVYSWNRRAKRTSVA